MYAFASLISKIFNVFTNALVAMLVAIFVQPVALTQQIFWLVIAVVSAAAPLGIYYLQYKKGNLTSFWSPKLEERAKANLAWVVAAAIFCMLAFWLESPRLILALGLVFLMVGVVNLALSSSFKISVHSEAVTLLILTLILTVSVNFVFLALLIILIGWSRIYLKAHDLSEVSLGVLVAVIAVFSIFNFFGFATF
jgi:membrane-associated phospholipid phosphatase